MKNLIYFVGILLALNACVPHKKLIYLRKSETITTDTVAAYKYKYQVQPNDILSVSVTSFNNQVTEFFNFKGENKLGGYLVSSSGYIHLPMLDSIYVMDLTISQVQDLLRSKIAEQVTQPYVLVSLINFQFSVLGEVGSRGVITSSRPELTILEALALAGDLTELADRAHVRLIRKVNDNIVINTINLNSRDIIQSEFFYIQPDDLIYVEPLKVKALRANIAQVSTYFGLLSLVVTLFVYIQSIQ